MAASSERVSLTVGPPAGARGLELRAELAPAGGETLDVAVLLRPRISDAELRRRVDELAARLPSDRRYAESLGVEGLGAPAASVDRVVAFAADNGLEVIESGARRRLVVLRGTVDGFRRALGVEFAGARIAEATHRVPATAVRIPADMADAVAAIYGLDDLPFADRSPGRATRAMTEPDTSPWCLLPAESPLGVAEHYGFPEGFDGTGQKVGVILLDGGFYPSDLDTFFRRLGVDPPKPEVVELGGQTMRPMPKAQLREYLSLYGLDCGWGRRPLADAGEAQDESAFWWTVEATWDLQLIGALAPGARVVAYFAPNNSFGKILAAARALADGVSVISGSWGAAESGLDEQFMTDLDRIFQIAAVLGVTVLYSSGDNGSAKIQFPATSPHALACGGTRLLVPSEGEQERTWNESEQAGFAFASGGGFSTFFPRPVWQTQRESSWRGIPDVASKANMNGGFGMVLAGETVPMGGTSSANPLWAALVARCGQALGRRVGYLNPLLYRPEFRPALTDITAGGNGEYHAGPGWDPCTGLGTPQGSRFLRALQGG